jgi:hypothetical protein
LQAEVGEDTLDAAGAEGVAGLADFLGQDGGRSVRIQEAMADDLLADRLSAAVGGFGAALLALQGAGAARLIEPAQLEIALLAEAEFAGSGQGAVGFAFAFVEHGQFTGDFVVVADGQRARGAGEDQAGRVGE